MSGLVAFEFQDSGRGENVPEEGSAPKPRVRRKDLDDAEVLTKSLEIDINEAQKIGADLTEAKQLLEEAKSHLLNQDLKNVKITVKRGKTALADAKRYHPAALLIQHALPLVNSVIKMVRSMME